MSYSTPWPDVVYRNLTVSGTLGSSANIDMVTSTPLAGQIQKNGERFIINPLVNNTFVGVDAGNLGLTGTNNTGCGYLTLANVSTGSGNIACGSNSLQFNTIGINNVAIGGGALSNSIINNNNTAVGSGALLSLNAGNNNVAIGDIAGVNKTTGIGNTFLGASSGSVQTTGDNNVYINNAGVLTESNTIRIGDAANQNKCFVAGIRNIDSTLDVIAAFVDNNGQLVDGTAAAQTLHVGKPGVVNPIIIGDGSTSINIGGPATVLGIRNLTLNALSPTVRQVCIDLATNILYYA